MWTEGTDVPPYNGSNVTDNARSFQARYVATIVGIPDLY